MPKLEVHVIGLHELFLVEIKIFDLIGTGAVNVIIMAQTYQNIVKHVQTQQDFGLL